MLTHQLQRVHVHTLHPGVGADVGEVQALLCVQRGQHGGRDPGHGQEGVRGGEAAQRREREPTRAVAHLGARVVIRDLDEEKNHS